MSMHKLKLTALALMFVLITATPALAAPEDKGNSPFYGLAMGAGFGVAFIIIGAGLGFGKIGSAALESMARQPEVAPRIFTTALIIGALLEGATFFALIICILMVL